MECGWKRLLSGLLALVLVIGMLPPATVAAEETVTEPAEVLETVLENTEPEETGASESTAPAVTESEETDPTETTEATLPENVHRGQALIDALPTVDTVTAEDYDAVQDAYDAYDALTEEEKAQVHGAEKFEPLFGWFNAQVDVLAVTSGTCGDNLSWTFNSNTGSLNISGTGDMYDFYTESAPWSVYEDYIKKVTIANGVTSISREAFVNCIYLASVSIPDSITSIGDAAFACCQSLTSVSLPDSVTTIGASAFSDCSKLKTINLTDSIISIGAGAFDSCSALTSVVLPSKIKTIGTSFFSRCTSLTTVTIPRSVTSIGANAFGSCSSLKDVYYGGTENQWNAITIDSSNGPYDSNNEPLLNATIHYSSTDPTYIAQGTCGDDLSWTLDEAGTLTISGTGEMEDYPTSSSVPWYSNRSSILSAVIENGVTSIGRYAFMGCSSLTSVIIPEGVTSIGRYAFSGCSSLTSVIIPKSVTSIGGHAFSECSSLTSVIIPKDVTVINEYVFSGCYNLASVTLPDNVTSIGDSAFQSCRSLASINFPERLISIETRAFANCSSLTSIVFPESITRIAVTAFTSCNKLTSITVDSKNTTYHSSNNCVIETASKTVVMGCATSVIPTDGSVTAIGSHAFYSCGSSLTSITIPDTVTSIGDVAFCECSGLTSITIPDSVTSIGDSAFCGCSGLTSITIPDSVTSIGSSAFSRCSGLTSITIPDSVTSIGSSAFSRCSSLTSIVFPDTVANFDSYDMFSNCPVLTNVNIPTGATSIGSSMFAFCSNLTSITIPDTVTSVGTYAFMYCDKLSNLTLSKNVTRLEEYAFYDCSLESLTVLGNISVGPKAFSGNIKSLTISGKVTFLDKDAFYGCYGLTSVVLSEDVTCISQGAFDSCENLTSITIPDSVTSIGDSAFCGCDGLTDVYYSGTQEQWNTITIGIRNDPLTGATIHYSSSGDAAVPQYGVKAQSDGMQDRTKIKFVVNDGESEDHFSVGKIIQYPEGTKIQVVITDEEPTGALFQVTVNGEKVKDNTFTVTEDAEVKVDCHYLYTRGESGRAWVYYNFWKDATTQAQMGPTPTFFASIRNRPDHIRISDYLDDPVTGEGGVWNLEQTITYGLGVQIDNTYLKYDTVTIQYFPYDASTGKFTDTPIELGEEPTGAGSAFAARGYEEKEKVRISYVLDGTTLYLDREVILQDGRRGWDGDRIQVCVRAKWADITEAYLKNAAIEALTAEGGNYSDQSFTVEDIILPENWNSIGEKIDNKYYFQADFVFQENERYFGGKAEGGLGFDIELLTPISLANESNKGTVVMTDANGSTVTDSAQAGQVTIQVTPKDGGYKVASVTVQNGEAEPVDVALTRNGTVATGTFAVENELPYTVTVNYDQRTVPAVTAPTVALNLYVGTNAYGDDYSARVDGLEENLLKAVLGTENTDGYNAYVWLWIRTVGREDWQGASSQDWKNPEFDGYYPKQLTDPLNVRVVRKASDGYTAAYWEGSVRLTDSRPAAAIQCAEVSPVTVTTDLNPVLEAVKNVTTDSASYTYSLEGTMPTVETPETSVTVTITAAESKTSLGGTKTVTVTAKLAGYTVTWQNWDGSELAENTVYYGQKPSYDTGRNETPEKKSAGKVYEWTGWEVTAGSENLNTDGTITGPVTYTATFTEKDDLNGNGKDDAAERAKVSLSHTGPGTATLQETEYIKRSGDDVIFDSVEENGNQLTIIVTPTPVVGDTSRKNVLKQVTVNDRDVTASVLDGKFTVALTNGETYTIDVTFEELTLNLKDNATIAVNKYADADRVTGLKEKLVAAVIGPEAKANDYKAVVEGAYDLDNLPDEIAPLSAKLLEESIAVTITDKNGLTDTVTVKLADSRKILAITIGDAYQQPDGSYQILIESEGEPADVMDRVKQAVTITANGTPVTVQDSYISCLPSYSWPQTGGEETFVITVRVNARENAEYQNCPQAVLTLKCKDTTRLPITSVQIQGEYYYSKGQTLTAKVEVKAGDITLKDTDYTISGNQGANAGGYTLTVTGTGIYTGTLNQSWSIHPAEVTITMKDATKKVNEDDPVNEPVVTVDKGELDVSVLGLDVTRKEGETAGVYPYTVTYRTSGNYTVTNKVSASLTIEDDGKAGLHPITFDPDDPTGTIQPGARVEIDGKAYILDEDCAAWIDSADAKVLQTFVYHTGEDAYHSYPTGMYVWYLSYQEDQGTYIAQRIPELDNYFLYQGTSIRVNFKNNGIRFNTSVSEADTNALIGGSLIKTEAMAGFQLTSAGTLFKWGTLTDTDLQNNGTTASSLVYGVAGESGFRVLQKNGDQNLFTGMLTGLGTDRDILNKDLVSRPYAVMERDGEEITIYGGTVQRSIYYVAKQNENWMAGTPYNDFIKSIITAVEEQPAEEEGEDRA